MKKYIIMISTCALGVLNFTSCDKKDNPSPESNVANPEIILDSTNLAIVSDTICGHLEDNVLKLSNGDTLKMYITIKGEYALSQYKIAAHENFDCHSHGEMKKMDDDLNAWSLNIIENIPGDVTTYSLEAVHVIPDSATKGQYHYSINAVDKDGREAEELEFNVVVE